MARFRFKFACGCESLTTLWGHYTRRERDAANLRSMICPDCLPAVRQRESAAAAAANAAAGLPTLRGTERQIAWAETIRHRIAGRLPQTDRDPVRNAQLAAVRQQDEARWWIDNRGERLDELLRYAVLEMFRSSAIIPA